ncbi:MAG: aminotransferase class I/II-fold pyridoxal phosphate-dependent enzyme [Clostridia bacterium]|nr:aminotransferase class I/II-fold pyridoxal phosphate-dependent enzyme [Clostridia bacterium]MBQ6614636.1 aminotransferase class I/II-fold pyridoxal phosphate-dependent enzyme [Clostridia bacterium]
MSYLSLSKEALLKEKEACLAELKEIADKGLSLDLSRGKPSKEQLSLSLSMLDTINRTSILDSESGQDCTNYGGLDGIPEAKRLFADMMGTHAANTLIGGNSSLTLMYQVVSHAMTEGVCGEKPWYEVKNRKFLCPVPGYDRHFAITEHFGFELISVPMLADGPDMDKIEELIKDDSVKGIWCVPKYQNPTGITFSDEVVRRFAALKPAAPDFRIFWDNAYCVHDFTDEFVEIPDIIDECEKAGNPNMVYEFCSTSKVTFPGSGVSALATSAANLIDIKSFLQFATIGPDKLNQLMHARYLKNMSGIKSHMKKHADILRPKFEIAYEILEKELAGTEIASWTMAKGGYFFSYVTMPKCASAIVKMSKEYGVTFTPAGATHPKGYDESDSDIRIAPSFATVDEIKTAVKVLALCTKVVSIDALVK